MKTLLKKMNKIIFGTTICASFVVSGIIGAALTTKTDTIDAMAQSEEISINAFENSETITENIKGKGYNTIIKQAVHGDGVDYEYDDSKIKRIVFDCYDDEDNDSYTPILFDILNTLTYVDTHIYYSSNNSYYTFQFDVYTGDFGSSVYLLTEHNADFYAPKDAQSMFDDFMGLETIEFNNFKTSHTINMVDMFQDCVSLRNLDLTSFNTPDVTNMSGMFKGCKKLKSLDLSSFNTNNVTNMNGMFQNTWNLDKITWVWFNTSNVTNMESMFSGCGLPEFKFYFNTSKVTNMSHMFAWSKEVKKLDLSSFNTNNVTNMNGMFYGCEGLTELDISIFNTSKVTDMGEMFKSCYKLETLNLSNFDTSNVTDMSGMFNGCKVITKLDLSNFDTSKVTDMAYMFNNCFKLKNLNVSAFNTKNSSMRYMFSGCEKLSSLNLTSFDFNGINCVGMFRDCSKLKTIYTDESVNYIRDEAGYGIFENCTSLVGDDGNAGFTQIAMIADGRTFSKALNTITNNDKSKIKKIVIRNYSCDTELDLSFYKGKIGSCCSLWFDNSDGIVYVEAYAGKTIYLNQDARYMFSNLTCYDVKIDLSKVDTSLTETMSGMFYESRMKSLDLSSFDTSRVESMSYMFKGCWCMERVYVNEAKWTTRNVAISDDMFTGCEDEICGLCSDFGTSVLSTRVYDKEYARVDKHRGNEYGYFSTYYIELPDNSNGVLDYTGSALTFNPVNWSYLSKYCEITGNTGETDRGTYFATIKFKDTMPASDKEYRWADGTTDPKKVRFSIEKKKIEIPYAKTTKFDYIGYTYTFTPDNWAAISEFCTISNNKGKEENTYVVTVTLKDTDKYQWTDGTTETKTLTYSIEKNIVALPVEDYVTILTYNGQEQTYLPFNWYKINQYCRISDNKATNAGEYTLTISLVDKILNKWADETVTDKTITFVINKQKVVVSQEGSIKDNTYTPSNWDSIKDVCTIVGNTNEKTGEYVASVTLNDTDNYYIVEEEVETTSVSREYKIDNTKQENAKIWTIVGSSVGGAGLLGSIIGVIVGLVKKKKEILD